jgi:hypothetical protein
MTTVMLVWLIAEIRVGLVVNNDSESEFSDVERKTKES